MSTLEVKIELEVNEIPYKNAIGISNSITSQYKNQTIDGVNIQVSPALTRVSEVQTGPTTITRGQVLTTTYSNGPSQYAVFSQFAYDPYLNSSGLAGGEIDDSGDNIYITLSGIAVDGFFSNDPDRSILEASNVGVPTQTITNSYAGGNEGIIILPQYEWVSLSLPNSVLSVTPTLTTVNIELATSDTNSVTTGVQTGEIAFSDSDVDTLPNAKLLDPTVTASGPGGVSLALTSAQQAAIAEGFTFASDPSNTNKGHIDWSFNPSSTELNFIALNENIRLSEKLDVYDQDGQSTISNITVNLSGGSPTAQLNQIAGTVDNILKGFSLLETSAAAISYQIGAVPDPTPFLEQMDSVYLAMGLAYSIADIRAQCVSDLQEAGDSAIGQWAAMRTAAVSMANEATKALFATTVGSLVAAYGLQAATWYAAPLATEAAWALAAQSGAAAELGAITIALGSTAAAPIIAAAVIAIGSGVLVDTVYDNYFSEPNQQTFSGLYNSIVPPPQSSPITIPLSEQVTVPGAYGTTLTVAAATAALATQLQTSLIPITNEFANNTLIVNGVSGDILAALPSGVSGLAEIDNGGSISLPVDYTAVVDMASSSSGVIASTAGTRLIVDGGTGDFTYSTASGSDTIYAGAGNNLLFGNAASLNVFAGAGNVSVIGGSGGNTVAGGSGNMLMFGTSTATYTGGDGAATIIGGTAGNTVSGGSGNMLLFGTSTATYTGGNGAATVIGGVGGLTAALGSGGGIVFGSPGGNNFLSASSGNATLVGAGAGDLVTAAGAGGDVLVAGSGAETLNGGAASGNQVLFGGTGANLLVGGSGDDLFLAGSGAETLTGGAGNNSFAFVATPGSTRSITITDFDPNHNAFGLFGYGDAATAGATVAASATTVGGNTSLHLSDGTTITLTGTPTLTPFNFFGG